MPFNNSTKWVPVKHGKVSLLASELARSDHTKAEMQVQTLHQSLSSVPSSPTPCRPGTHGVQDSEQHEVTDQNVRLKKDQVQELTGRFV